ncbi:excision repair cross-complementing rodent repair deficiency, complementation group 8 [Halteromyces radiatus]|uniref:excision repair cross-complementing rodent repair deficiency, complementation group 8 n=1 Tax=Halteromyces radiatus TaxID=101107 RepID=UPI00221F929B|nr:excision repair cross-complementing rodent repair deficiency, complementation group 8 [Halteromyces radiatus]KAI8079841.1 excision repair cross-complementing rodent repair deficiency, complementation group 8 [Halteromyces radiatus]
MYSFLKKREQGSLQPIRIKRAETTKRIYNVQLSQSKEVARAHRGGVTCLKMETIEQRYLMSGGSDGRIHIYDLHMSPKGKYTKIVPIASVSRYERHKYAVSSLSWFPFDTGMFISSSFDKSIRIWDTNSMTPACTFPLDSRVYCQAISPIASHCLVASAAAEPRIRLCDLKSGAFTHSLMGHSGEIYSCIWSPSQEHILYSGGNDGTVRVWDIRRAASCIMSLDQENSRDSLVDRDPLAETNSAHGNKGVNGMTLSSDGRYLVTLGMDEKIRLWDTNNGHNTFVNYGSYWRNRFKSCLQAVVSDADVWPPLLFVPSDDQQVLVFGLMDGRLTKRLKGAYGRVTSVEQRSSYQELYSGSNEGEILVWEPTKPVDQDGSSSIYDITTTMEMNLDAWSDSDDEDERPEMQ